MVTKAYKFQKVGVRKIYRCKGRTLLADEMGLGKTFQAYFYIWLFKESNCRTLVICPKTIKEGWQDQLKEHFGVPSDILNGRKPNLTRISRKHTKTVIINYDILGKLWSAEETWAKIIKRWKPHIVIVDEGHYISNPAAQRSKNVRGICEQVPELLVLTGTPLTKRPADLWNIINLIWPKRFPSFKRFAIRHCRPEWTPWGMTYKGAVRLKELNRKLKRAGMIRRRMDEVFEDLPKKKRIIIPVEIDNRKEYEAMEKETGSWLRKTKGSGDSDRTMNKMVKIGYLLRLIADGKRKAITEWIDSFLEESDRKLIVFGHHRKMVRGLNEQYAAISTRVDGGVVGKKRFLAIKKFLRNDRIRLFFGNLLAAGVGWSAKGVGKTLTVEYGWRPGDHVQADARIFGIGRGVEGEQSTNYYMVAQDTVEEDLVRTLQKRMKVISTTLDGRDDTNDLNIADEMEEVFLKRLREKRGFNASRNRR